MKRTIFQKITLGAILLFLVWALGIHFVFHACGPKEDGTYMSCHYAELWVTVFFLISAVMEMLVLIHPSRSVRSFLLAAAVVFQVVILILPQRLIRLCMMEDMRCWRLMKPAATVGAVLGFLLLAIQWMVLRKEGRHS